MPVYDYTAFDAKGHSVSGVIDAESPTIARQKIRTSGNFPVTVRESARQPTRKAAFLFKYFHHIRQLDMVIMLRQLGTLMNAGFPLVAALDALIPQTRSTQLKNLLFRIKDAVVGGSSFSDAMGQNPGVFPPLYVNMIRAGESSGTLGLVLDRLAEMIEKQEQVKQRIISAMIYPAFMTVIGTVILLFLITYIVPTIAGLFADMKQVLPLPTRMLIGFSRFIQIWWWILPNGLIVAVMGFHHVRKTEYGRFVIDNALISLPVIGEFLRKIAGARIARTLGLLLGNGVSLLSALELVKNISGNAVIAEAVSSAADSVRQGQGLARSLAATSRFPDLFIQMIQVGEQSGALETLLKKAAELYESEVESAMMRLASLMEPVMILVMGVTVGFIVLSICMPIFEMNQLVH